MADAIKVVSKFFFDSQRVQNAVDRAARQALSKFGSYVRQRAKTSIRNAPKKLLKRDPDAVSQPGQPPFNRTGRLRDQIFFSFDPSSQSVVIGPILYGSKTGAPEHLEYGGVGTIHNAHTGKAYQKFIRPRPFMTPAFNAELHNAALQFKDLIR